MNYDTRRRKSPAGEEPAGVGRRTGWSNSTIAKSNAMARRKILNNLGRAVGKDVFEWRLHHRLHNGRLL